MFYKGGENIFMYIVCVFEFLLSERFMVVLIVNYNEVTIVILWHVH